MPSSPRTRRYFRGRIHPLPHQLLFSAHAEVFPLYPAAMLRARALLRARGGISLVCGPAHLPLNSSPRTRRYFPGYVQAKESARLFSAHAEVFPNDVYLFPEDGGSSPRTRRYFHLKLTLTLVVGLFSAHAEVFPPANLVLRAILALLRARGGISTATSLAMLANASSPRTRRYFR